MKFEHINKQAVTFCAIALLFLGSLYYFVSIALSTRDSAHAAQNQIRKEYLDNL